MKLFFCQNDPLMGEPFWQNNSLVSHIFFELQPIIIFSPVTNFGDQSLFDIGTTLYRCKVENFLKKEQKQSIMFFVNRNFTTGFALVSSTTKQRETMFRFKMHFWQR